MPKKPRISSETDRLVADKIIPPDPNLSEFEQQMFIARQIMANDREMLAKLAKL